MIGTIKFITAKMIFFRTRKFRVIGGIVTHDSVVSSRGGFGMGFFVYNWMALGFF